MSAGVALPEDILAWVRQELAPYYRPREDGTPPPINDESVAKVRAICTVAAQRMADRGLRVAPVVRVTPDGLYEIDFVPLDQVLEQELIRGYRSRLELGLVQQWRAVPKAQREALFGILTQLVKGQIPTAPGWVGGAPMSPPLGDTFATALALLACLQAEAA